MLKFFKICIQSGWLRCNPGRIKDNKINTEVNIQSTTSYISGFGPIANPIKSSAYSPPTADKRVCRTNEYSPGHDIFK